MGTFTVTSSNLNCGYEYKNESVEVSGSYSKDATTDTMINVSGTAYVTTPDGRGDYIGNFNGYMRDGEVRYSLSEMSRKNSNLVWNAIDEIELNIIGTNEEE